MKELIKVQTNSQGEKVVSAKELYEFLDVKSNFTTWCKRMFEYGFEENKDFVLLSNFGTQTKGGHNAIDYALTLDASKEIAMLQRSEKGKQARLYFLECEKTLKEITKPIDTLDFLEMSLKQMRDQANRITQVETKLLELEAKTTSRPEYFTVMGYAILSNVKVGLALAAQIGKRAKIICQNKGYQIEKIRDPRFGQVGCYPTEVLQEVFSSITIV